MRWEAVLGISVSVVLVLTIGWQVDFAHLAVALQSVRVLPLVLAALVFVSTHCVRAWRWSYLLAPLKPMPFTPLVSAIAIGFMANMLLPVHAGEIVRAYLVGQKARVGTMTTLATIVMEKVADLISLLTILLVVFGVGSMPMTVIPITASFRVTGSIATLLFLLLLSSLWLLKTRTVLMTRVVRNTLAFLPAHWVVRLLAVLGSFALGLQALQKGQHIMAILGVSFALWGLIILGNVLVLHACGLSFSLPATIVIVVVEIFGVALPSAPGFIGTYHATVVAGLMVFGVTYEVALSSALIMHASFFFPFILTGFPFLWWESLSLRDLWSVQAQERQP